MISPNYFYATSFGALWVQLLEALVNSEHQSLPRGLPIRELLNVKLELTNPYRNILVNAKRSVKYRFMLAEWLWIWYGHDDVKTIAKYNPNIAKFSDNGIDFNGAYGKAVQPHWLRIVDTLTRDPASRQAVITIYKAPPQETKDTPCTVSVQWIIRDKRLHCIVTMRSSDIWLGLPYDVFNFTMLTNLLGAQLNLKMGTFWMNLGSSHLYDVNFKEAKEAVDEVTGSLWSPQFEMQPGSILEHSLMHKKRSYDAASQLPYPWYEYHYALHADTNKDAYKILVDISTNARRIFS